MKNYAQALKYYSEAIRIDPKESVCLYNRGITYYKINKNTN
jgi:tetratricopeptide (TPR) repeat protein